MSNWTVDTSASKIFKPHNPPLYDYNYKSRDELSNKHYWSEICANCGSTWGRHSYAGTCLGYPKVTGRLTKTRDLKRITETKRELSKHKKWREK